MSFNTSYDAFVTVIPDTIVEFPEDTIPSEIYEARSGVIQTKIVKLLNENNAKKELVLTAFLTRIDLFLTSPQTKKFDFMNSLEVFITADGLTDVVLSKFKVNDSTNTIVLSPTDVDLQTFIKKESLQIGVRMFTPAEIDQSYKFSVQTFFEVRTKTFID